MDAKEKALEKAKKALDSNTKDEMDGMTAEQLEKVIVEAEQGMDQAKHELQENSAYRAAKEALKELNGGLREVNKRQKAKIALALHLLEAKGKI